MLFADFDAQEFLTEYWQKKPLLIRSSGSFIDPLTSEDLFSLAQEPSVESRLIEANSPDGPWHLRHGPFHSLPDCQDKYPIWTLLVQAVDQWLPEANLLKQEFNFVPNWRIDDVMVSFATAGAGVGPHYDQYDVFLLQGAGKRQWKLGGPCDHTTKLAEHDDLRLLENFNVTDEYILNKGDILYLPPRFAHFGTSLDNSVCYSIGFRAPSWAEMIQGLSDKLIDGLQEDQRFSDEYINLESARGMPNEQSINANFLKLRALFNNKTVFDDWLGEYASLPKYPELIEYPDPEISENKIINLINNATQLVVIYKNSFSRFVQTQTPSGNQFYVDGSRFYCSDIAPELIQKLCAATWDEPLPHEMLLASDASIRLFTALVNQGSLVLGTEN